MAKARELTEEEFDLLCDNFSPAVSLLSVTLLNFLAYTGYRIEEALSLKLRDVVSLNGEIKKRITVAKKNTKGGKKKGKGQSASIDLNHYAIELLTTWKEHVVKRGFMRKDNLLFCKDNGTPYTYQPFYRQLKKAAIKAGLDPEGISTHCGRKRFANILFRDFNQRLINGESHLNPLVLTSKALRHKSIATTEAYLTVNEDDITQSVLTMFNPK